MFICINWVYLHVRFIVPIIRRPRRRTELPLQANHTLEQQKNKFETLKITNRNIMSKKSIGDFLNVSEKMDENSKKTNRYRTTVLFLEKFLKKFSRFLISIASFSIFGSIISTIVYCLFYILHETNQYLTISAYSMNNSAVICCSMLVLIIPMMFLVGIPLIASNLDLKNKLFLFPIFGLVLPICITLPIANSLQHDSNFLTFTSYLIYGPPFISIFWLFLIYMSQHGRKILFFVTTFFCLFFVVPLAFLSPLINTDGFLNMDSARAGMAILLTVGSFILLLYLVYLCLRKFGQSYILTKEELAKQPKFQFFNYLRQNCENFGLFGNGVGFIITITILIYGIFNKPSYIKPSQDGSLAGLVIVVCLLFIFLTMIIRMPILNPQKVYTQSINDQFEKEFIPERRNLIKRQGIIRLIVIIFGFVIVPLILVPIIIVKRDEDDTKYLLLTALIGNFCVVIIFQLFYSIKKSYEEFGKSLIPGLSIFCWLFVFIPFVAIIPITIVNLSPEEDIALLYKITVGVAAMFIFLGIFILIIIIKKKISKSNFITCKCFFQKVFFQIIKIINRFLTNTYHSILLNIF